MDHNQQRVSRGAHPPPSHPASEPGPDDDFAWPPSDDDLSACGVIRLDGGDAHTATVRSPSGHGHRVRHWGVEQADYPFHVDSDRPASDSSPDGETRRAALALAAGLTLAVLSYSQFRGGHGVAPKAMSVVAEAGATLSDVRGGPEPVMDPPAAGGDDRGAVLPLGRLRGESARPFGSSVSHEPARPIPAAVTAPSPAVETAREVAPMLALASPLPVAVPVSVPVSVPLSAPAAPSAEARNRPDAAIAARELVEAPLEVARPSAPVAMAAAYTAPGLGEEDHIRAALSRWRTAYSSLDANAAREVWPSVDTRALERAFQALKSQDLRFDRCDLTVRGGSAQAACSGRAVYVPRVGNQSPRDTAREWRFELKKLDERWTIASARAS